MEEISVNDHNKIDAELTEEEISEILQDLPRYENYQVTGRTKTE